MNHTLLSCIDSRVVGPMKFYGRFELGPFAPGQGLTVANSLRRSLLSQLTGAAIPLVEISGALHEYETLTGVKESILDILLNIKQMILTSDFEFFSTQVGFLNVKGPGIVRARDLKLPNFIYLVDPNQYIATLTTNGSLSMKFVIACGKNPITHTPGSSVNSNWVALLKKASPPFALAKTSASTPMNYERNKESSQSLKLQRKFSKSELLKQPKSTSSSLFFYQQWKNERTLNLNGNHFGTKITKKISSKVKLSSPTPLATESNNRPVLLDTLVSNKYSKIGYFTIDATFMPVTQVNYLIQSTDSLQLAKDRVILEVWTNGSIHPRHAINKAAQALIQLLLPLQQMKNTGLSFTNQHQSKANNIQSKDFTSQLTHSNSLPNKLNNQEIRPSDSIEKTTFSSQQNVQFDVRILGLDIGNLDLTLRPYSILKQANIHTIRDLLSYSKNQLREILSLAPREFNQIELALFDFNLHLKMDFPE